MGGLCDPGNLQHHSATGQGLCQRRPLPDTLLSVRRNLRDQLRGPKREISETTGHRAAQALESPFGTYPAFCHAANCSRVETLRENHLGTLRADRPGNVTLVLLQ